MILSRHAKHNASNPVYEIKTTNVSVFSTKYMRGVHNSCVVVKRPIKLFYNFSFHACGYAMPAACGDLLFVTREDAIERLKKSRRAGYNCDSSSKMPPSNAGRLAQRKPFVCKHKRRWPFEFGWTTDVRCETDSRAVRCAIALTNRFI